MKSPLVRDLKPEETVTTIFLVHSKEVRQKRTGEPYLSLLLADRSGEIDCKMWDNVAGIMDTFQRDDFIKVKGLLQIYNNRPQFTIHRLRRVADHEVDFRDFFPASSRDIGEMWTELRGIVSSIENPDIRALLEAFLADPRISERFQIAPAAKSIHHAFRGGLLEHVLSLCNLSKVVSKHYNADLSLVLAGCVLHDIGKIHELSYDRGFGYSPEGQLVGHIGIAMRMLSDKLRDFPQFPVELRNLIEHMILSHHGRLEFGSPKLPIFPEALLLHYIDDMDSKMECMRALTEKDSRAQGCFTSYSASLERVALRKEKYLESAATPCAPESLTQAATSPISEEFDGVPQASLPAEVPSLAANGRPANIADRAPAPALPDTKPVPVVSSFFGAKLQQALQDERK